MKSYPSFTVAVGTSGKQITVNGNMFNYKTDVGLYLSSNKFDGTQKYYDFYSSGRSVSAGNPPFSAYPMPNYKDLSNNTLTFTLPAFYTPQKLDIIFANDAGYALASSSKQFSYIEVI
jgi:hypothetical protein